MEFDANSKLIMHQQQQQQLNNLKMKNCYGLTLKSLISRQQQQQQHQEQQEASNEKKMKKIAKNNNKFNPTTTTITMNLQKHKIKSKMSQLVLKSFTCKRKIWNNSLLLSYSLLLLVCLMQSACFAFQFLQPQTDSREQNNNVNTIYQNTQPQAPTVNLHPSTMDKQPIQASGSSSSSSGVLSSIVEAAKQATIQLKQQTAQDEKSTDSTAARSSTSASSSTSELGAQNSANLINVDSPLGKITDAIGLLIDHGANNSTLPAQQASVQQQQGTNVEKSKAANSQQQQQQQQQQQALKPRAKVDPLKHQASAEQQIINQHAGFNLLHSPTQQQQQPQQHQQARFQHLSPVKHKSSSSIFASISSDQQKQQQQQLRFPEKLLTSIIDSFKSSDASSRSSIVKAISDNKLARTISEVGKSISSNKYFASAAIASVVAAVGLSLSKLFANPLGAYSKLGPDPMLGSDSMLRPEHHPSPAYNWLTKYYQTDRTQAPASIIGQQQAGQYPSSQANVLSGTTSQWSPSYAQDLASLIDSAASNINTADTIPPTTYNFANPNLDPTLTLQTTPRIYYTFQNPKPVDTQSSSGKHLLKPVTASDASGHYASYYEHNGLNGVEPAPNQPHSMPQFTAPPPPPETPTQNYYPMPSSIRFPSGSDSMESSNNNELFTSGSAESTSFVTDTQSRYNNAQQQQQQQAKMRYQMLPNVYRPPSVGSGQQVSTPSSSSAPRRSGPVTLKLDEATRARLYEQLKNQARLYDYANSMAASSIQETPVPLKMVAEKSPFIPMKASKTSSSTPTTTTTTTSNATGKQTVNRYSANKANQQRDKWEPQNPNGLQSTPTTTTNKLKVAPNGDHHGSLATQTIKQQGQHLGYQLIMPVTSSGSQQQASDSMGVSVNQQAVGSKQAQKSLASSQWQQPEANTDNAVNINTPHTQSGGGGSSSSSSAWKSFSTQDQQQQSESAENGWRSVGESKQTTSAPSDQQQLAIDAKPTTTTTTTTTTNTFGANSLTSDQLLLQRVSRTPSKASVKQANDNNNNNNNKQQATKQQQQQQQSMMLGQAVGVDSKSADEMKTLDNNNKADNDDSSNVGEDVEPATAASSEKSVAAFDSQSGGLVIMLPASSSSSAEETTQQANNNTNAESSQANKQQAANDEIAANLSSSSSSVGGGKSNVDNSPIEQDNNNQAAAIGASGSSYNTELATDFFSSSFH